MTVTFAARKREANIRRADWHAEWLGWCGMSIAFKRAATESRPAGAASLSADQVRTTVPGRQGKDPVLLEREQHQGAPMPADVRVRIAQLTGRQVAAA